MNLSGLLLVDKPEGVNSHAIVSFVRKSLGISKVGHLGTLDPFASGLLPIMIGGFTRMSDSLMSGDKGYLFTIAFGTETDTLDTCGQVVAQAPLPKQEVLQNADGLEKILDQFRGTIRQTPPAYSALKHKGRPLYEYMRTQGKLGFDIEEKAREITVKQLKMEGFEVSENHAELTLHCICTKGTYVRALARDISKALGSVGHCKTLRRTHVSNFRTEEALRLTPEDLKNAVAWKDEILNQVQSSRKVFPEYPCIIVPSCEEQICQRLEAGNAIEVTTEQWNSWLTDKESSKLLFSGNQGFVGTKRVLFLAQVQITEDHPQSVKQFRLSPQKLIEQSLNS